MKNFTLFVKKIGVLSVCKTDTHIRNMTLINK